MQTIQAEILVPAAVYEVWRAWTTSEGCESFFAPQAQVKLRPLGPFEQLFDLDSPKGQQGSEGCVILAYEPNSMLSFTWNAPPNMPEIRQQRTHVTLYFSNEVDQTRLVLIHDGWGKGDLWQQAFDYFDRAWKQVVLPRLVYRFTHEPVDWANPNAFREI